MYQRQEMSFVLYVFGDAACLYLDEHAVFFLPQWTLVPLYGSSVIDCYSYNYNYNKHLSLTVATQPHPKAGKRSLN